MGRSKVDSDLTPALRRWLPHLRRCAREGGTIRAYAKRHGLSEWALYTAKRELRAKGVLPPAKREARAVNKRRGRAPKPPQFIEVKAERPVVASYETAWRARLPNGVVVEGNSPLGPVVAALAQL
jgi:hypothetical protein